MGEGETAKEISHLFFVDATFLFCQPEERALLNLRCVLLCFQACRLTMKVSYQLHTTKAYLRLK